MLRVLFCAVVMALFGVQTSHAFLETESTTIGKVRWDDRPPWFCRGKDCPKYKVEGKESDYEVRTYDKGYWVATNVTGSTFVVALGRAFTSLYRYFNGANKDHEKMSLTTPYVTYMELKDHGKATERNYTIALLVPFKYQDDPPKPTSENVELMKNPRKTVYVRSVEGFATEGSFLEERKKLADALRDEGEKYDKEGFFAAVYDAPTRLRERYNEVWVPKEEVSSA